ncbi:hypothetical protein NSPZN2_11463 [Nitrospira defluvii]|uniref:Uncharacterized protein n=1 Tax=Nitrospira defluvii TaxID=330214 RepID=A0ABM8QUK0_9BACT|nr:hypothetical protein NSPZN2_11463 [Nitrospira defluvii]
MFLDLHANLFGDVGPCGQFRHALTHQGAFTQITLALPDQKAINIIGLSSWRLRPILLFRRNALLPGAHLAERAVGMVADIGGRIRSQRRRGDHEGTEKPPSRRE